MKNVRLGIIGMGNMGKFHADYLLAGKVSRAQLVALASRSASADRFNGLKIFQDPSTLIRSGEVDAVIIATPHYQHTTLGIEALQHELHVMVEKPISVHKRDAERLLQAHRNPRQILAAMFQLRAEPRYQKMRRLITQGDLGEIVRVNWIITDWFRTEAYYASGGWRATWKGEGGGVLLNQCPHNLDLLLWLCGPPARVRGFCQFGRYHDIEVEDNVTFHLEYPNGATGVFVTSTGEAPGTNRLEIAGERGRLVLEQGRLLFTRNETPMSQFSRQARTGFTRPDVWQVEIPADPAPAPHVTIMQNFVHAILDGEPLLAPAAEGLGSVELANAVIYSSLTQQTIDLPLDGAAYEQKLQDLIGASRFEKKVVEIANDDFTKSFNR
jgi:predicted dehydrogenase